MSSILQKSTPRTIPWHRKKILGQFNHIQTTKVLNLRLCFCFLFGALDKNLMRLFLFNSRPIKPFYFFFFQKYQIADSHFLCEHQQYYEWPIELSGQQMEFVTASSHYTLTPTHWSKFILYSSIAIYPLPSTYNIFNIFESLNKDICKRQIAFT